MNLRTFSEHLASAGDQPVGFVFDDGELIPAHFHIPEVGHVAKTLIDRAGAVRKTEAAQLQVWVGDDEDHRFTCAMLAKLIDLAKPLFPSGDLDVEVEYEGCVVSQYTVERALNTGRQLLFQLADKAIDVKEATGNSTGVRSGR